MSSPKHHGDHHVDREEHWNQENGLFKAIYKAGIPHYFNELPNIRNAFDLGDRTVRCIDEGTPGGLHIAGSGILLNPERASGIFKRAQADGVTSHKECGAAALAFAKLPPEEQAKYGNAEAYGVQFAQALARHAHVPYKGHLVDLERPSGLHTARIIYYDGTGRFNCNSVPGLPKGFVISRRFLPSAYAKEEVKVAIEIALGSHGFGSHITKEAPLVIVAIGDPDDDKFSLFNVNSEILEYAVNPRVKCGGFTADL